MKCGNLPPKLHKHVVAVRANLACTKRIDAIMALKTYNGSCHCGSVRFEVTLDLSQGVNKCNCSICTKARAWFAIVRPEQLKLLSGGYAQTTYQWVPRFGEASNLQYQFCKTCGIRTFGRGEEPGSGSTFYFVNIAALDDAEPDELASAPVRYVDGRHDRYDQPPDDLRLL